MNTFLSDYDYDYNYYEYCNAIQFLDVVHQIKSSIWLVAGFVADERTIKIEFL